MTSSLKTSPLTKLSVRCSLAASLLLAGTSWLSVSAQPLQPSIAQPDTSLETPLETPALLEGTESLEAPAQASPTETDELAETDQTQIDTVNFADEKISVNYPATWQLKMLDDGILISNVATTPAELVATQIVRMAAPPGAVVNANIESFTEEGSAVARYTRATIDGQDALVMWLADRPDDLGSAIATFIGYDTETVLLFSRYAPENATAEENILQIHTSFTDPAAVAIAEEDTPTTTNAPKD